MDFLASWPLFLRPYLLTLTAAALLSLVGVVAAARRQVFVAAAVAQASTLGYALFGLFAGGSVISGLSLALRDALSVAAAVLAAALTMLGGAGLREGSRLDADELTAAVFILGGAGSVLALSGAPAGMEQLRRLQASSVIGASTPDVVALAVLLIAAAAFLLVRHRALVLVLTDPVLAAAIGLRLWAWNLGLAVACGLTLGLAVRSTGVLYAFAVLALPVMIAKQFSGRVRDLLVAAPAVAVGCGLLGLYLAYDFDLPPGQVIAVLLCLLLTLAALARTAWEAAAAGPA
ncbi:metal ABC transporter permease [Phycisphaera mikurensis]|uniref:ABC transporter permease protein n=1 Tax=Phycisphaera mikurensis (strain NBRC 102666 / KCTC 22515 / FYK2301M01) TaxID=1142394 RepID=I0IEM8_PHYMF|nr:metal ABC transporter permease [Phycisphaera mikurensis]BAM03716.1 ABC transporter permease protein [Phycisphaera mikurensis NBRC 102666]